MVNYSLTAVKLTDLQYKNMEYHGVVLWGGTNSLILKPEHPILLTPKAHQQI